MVFTTEEFLEVAIESWPGWDLNPPSLNFVQTLNQILLQRKHKTICKSIYFKMTLAQFRAMEIILYHGSDNFDFEKNYSILKTFIKHKQFQRFDIHLS